MKRIFSKDNLIKALFIISGTSLSISLSTRGAYRYRLIGVLVAFICLLLYSCRNQIKYKYEFPIVVISIIFSIYTNNSIQNNFKEVIKDLYLIFSINGKYTYIINLIFYLLPLFFLYLCFTYFILKIKNIFLILLNDINRCEKIYFIISTIIICVVGLIIYSTTTIFTTCITREGWTIWNALYGADSHIMAVEDVFFNINHYSNDYKQLLFAVFVVPFSTFAHLLTFCFSPIVNEQFNYLFLMFCIQIIVMQISVILAVKLLDLNNIKTIICCLIINVSYSLIVFSFLLEQYLFSTFWLILFIYFYSKHDYADPFLFLASSGSLLTNIIILPFFINLNNIKQSIKKMMHILIIFVGIISIFGQFQFIVSFISSSHNDLLSYGGKYVIFIDKLRQYLYYVRSIFLAPKQYLYWDTAYVCTYKYILPTYFDFVGILIMIFCIISIFHIKNKKNKIIAGGWYFYSFIILCVLGLGISENELFLYSYYFSWGFFLLIFSLLGRLKTKHFILVGCLIIIILLAYNIPELLSIIDVGKTFYPA